MSDLEGVMLSDYFLTQCVSKGGMADVYRARQQGEGNFEVAVKVYRSSYAQRASFRDYFMAEADKIGQFDQPNILPLLEFGEGDGLLYVVTPYIAHGTLEELLQRVGGKFSAMQALPIMQQMCSAVQYAHGREVLHGNIKPTNVFVGSDGRMLLSDFGIARGYDDSQQSLTRVGWGSAEYAAPEQSLGVLRRASDIYSLGVLLFRLLTGQPPFTGQTPVEVLLKHVRQQPPSARTIVPSISDAVDGVLQMALQKRADDRFASAEEFSNAFLAAVTVAPVASPVARTVSALTPVAQPARVINPLTPIPAFPIAVAQPQTPVPAQLMSSSATPAWMPENPGLPSSFEEKQYLQSWHSGGYDNEHGGVDALPAGQKPLLDEGVHGGKNRFWSVDPVEWSPIDNEQNNAIPLTAEDYLRDQLVVPVIPNTPKSQPAAPAPLAEVDTRNDDKGLHNGNSLNVRLKKALPIVVVVLLLLGLLGALLSSFFYPGSGHGAFMLPHVALTVHQLGAGSVAFSGVLGVGNRACIVGGNALVRLVRRGKSAGLVRSMGGTRGR